MLERAIKSAGDAFSGLLDLIYPPHCLVCGAVDTDYFCKACIEDVIALGPRVCRKCGIECESALCGECRSREYVFEYARSAAIFEGTLREAIHALKYQYHLVIADSLAGIFVRCFPETHLKNKVDLVIPIPVHHSRMLERGFNQSIELANRFCKRVSLPVEIDVLYKAKNTAHQVDLPYDLRAINVEGSFGIRNVWKVAGKRVLVMDDVFTTGATLNEAAKVLLGAGAVTVYGYTLARSL